MAVETPDVHLKQCAQLLPSPHQLQRIMPRQVFVALRMGDEDLPPGIEHLAVSNAVSWANAWAENQVHAIAFKGVRDAWVVDVHSVAEPTPAKTDRLVG